jgi:alpha-glucosidase (family GH31 glycosyl hydrolase)
MKRVPYWALGFAFAVGVGSIVSLAQDAPPYSSSQGYKAMLAELGRPDPRPSRVSAAATLDHGQHPSFPIEAGADAAGLSIATSTFRFEVSRNPLRISFHNNKTGALWVFGDNIAGPGIEWAERKNGQEITMPLIRLTNIRKVANHWLLQCNVKGSSEPADLEIAVISPEILRITANGIPLGDHAGTNFHVRGRGPFFGLGEQYFRANLDDLKIDLHPSDHPGTPGHDWDYMSIPFVYNPHAIGIFFDTSYDVTFDSTQGGEDGFEMRIAGPQVSFYLLAAERPAGILTEYTAITGRPPVPPPWTFGVWHNSLQGGSAVLADAERIREERIPMSALWVSDMMNDPTNLGWPLWTVGYYGSPREFNDKLHSLGFRVLGYVHPYVRLLLLPYRLHSSTFEYGLSHHYFVVKPNGKPDGPTFEPCPTANIDFTNPKAVDWWQGMIHTILIDSNFDGWMEDFGEWINDDDQFAAEKTGRVMATLNPLLYHKITYEITHELKPDAVEFSRSGAPGSQAFTPVMWGGDQVADWSKDNGLPSVVTAGITAGLSGFAVWGPDIVSASKSKELYIRWLEFGALTPVMRDHLWDKPQFAVDLWFDQDTINTFRRYARLHISLFPYFYTFSHQAAKTGMPIIRHLMLVWPNDPNTYETEYEYLLGDRILVAPVVSEDTNTRRLYLPQGSWVDYWNGQILRGEQEITVPAPLHEIPILVKAGAIVPLIDPDTQTLAVHLANRRYRTLDSALTWRVFPSNGISQSRFEICDGTSATVDQSTSDIRVKGRSSIIRPYKIMLPLNRPPTKVTLGNVTLEQVSAAGYRAGKEGWWLDRGRHLVDISFTADNFSLAVLR